MIKAIIVDDESLAISRLNKMLVDSGYIDVAETFTSPIDAVRFLEGSMVDVAFLDIDMPDTDGICLANQILDLQKNIDIVFVTAYSEYAVEAFRLNALDYLLKPVVKSRLNETIKRIMEEKNVGNMSAGRLNVYCFGKMRVVFENEENEVKWRTSKSEELFAYLIHKSGERVSRNEIIDRLWGEYDGDRAVTHFNTSLHYIKKTMSKYGIEKLITSSSGTYKLDNSKIYCDYYEVNKLLSADKEVDDDTIQEFETVESMYTGDYFEGNDFTWSEGIREIIKEKYCGIVIKIADYYLKKDDYIKNIEILKKGLLRDDLNQRVNYRIIKTYILINDRVSAIRCFDIYKKRLKEEFGIEPDISIKQLLG